MLTKSTQRIVFGAAAAAGFATLFLASRTFAVEFDPGIVSEETVHNIAHVVVYGGLALMLTKGLGRRWIYLAWLISIVLATSEELFQMTVPGRVPSIQDGMLNIVSITLALALINLEPAVRALYQMIINPDSPRHAIAGDVVHHQPDSPAATMALVETAIGRDVI